LSIERAGGVYSFVFPQRTPDLAFQTAKVTNILLALLCWITGYLLGIIRRHEAIGSPLVAWFWSSMGGILACYFVARYASFPLRLALQCLLLTLLAPLLVYIHVWFPVRPVMPKQARAAQYALVVTCLVLVTGLMAGIVIWQPTLMRLMGTLGNLLPTALLTSFIGSGIILQHHYRRTTVNHTRRQIRLIALACFFVAFVWLLLGVFPTFIIGIPLIAYHWLDLTSGLIPLAYLIGGVTPDLYRIDRIVVRLAVHAGTILVLAAILVVLTTSFGLHGTLTVLWIAVCFVVLYRPVQNLCLRLLPTHRNLAYTYDALHATATKLTTTLEASILIDAVRAGVHATFGAPALAFYIGNIEGSNELTLMVSDRLSHLPKTIVAGTLTDHLGRLSSITESRMLHATLAQIPLNSVEEQALRYPGVVLWCPIRHIQGYLLGILLLGMRGDLDPYRAIVQLNPIPNDLFGLRACTYRISVRRKQLLTLNS
jgi:hypothetical protein